MGAVTAPRRAGSRAVAAGAAAGGRRRAQLQRRTVCGRASHVLHARGDLV